MFVGVSVALVAAVFMVACWAYGDRVRLRAMAGGGYAHWEEFPLRDSLPALEGGLSNLEAFKVTMSPFRKADPERALWVSDSLGALRVEYVGDKNPFDSVVLMSWATGQTLRTRTFRTRDAVWSPWSARAVDDWVETVTAYVSYPPLITFRPVDPLVNMFEPAEGKVLHVVGRRYFSRALSPVPPDTTYAVTGPEAEVQVVVRGDALAVINPSPRVVVLGLVAAGSKGVTAVRGEPGRVSIYRTVMRGRVPPVLAWTDPGVTYPVFRERDATPRRFFVWNPGGASR